MQSVGGVTGSSAADCRITRGFVDDNFAAWLAE
jgi:hypothetical protein